MSTHHSNAKANLDAEALAQAWQFIQSADALAIAAGAGLGVESGLPDFRGPNGLWKHYPGLAKANLSFQEIANPDAFACDPELAWGFYGHRLQSYRAVQPHAGFKRMLEWGQAKPHGWAVFTSNVDGQFQKAGYTQHPVMECHGSLHFLQCATPCSQHIWPANGFSPAVDTDTSRLTNALPVCSHCGGLARPNVLMFSDGQWVEHRTQAQQTAMRQWLAVPNRGTVLEIGAGTAVATVRAFSNALQRNGWKVVRVNPECHTHANPNAVELQMTAGGFFAAISALEGAQP